jgi:hypothetical protein
MQFIAPSITPDPALGLPFRTLEGRDLGPLEQSNCNKLVHRGESFPQLAKPSRAQLHACGWRRLGVVVAYRDVALAHSAARVQVEFQWAKARALLPVVGGRSRTVLFFSSRAAAPVSPADNGMA